MSFRILSKEDQIAAVALVGCCISQPVQGCERRRYILSLSVKGSGMGFDYRVLDHETLLNKCQLHKTKKHTRLCGLVTCRFEKEK
jgi:hypothetical protein